MKAKFIVKDVGRSIPGVVLNRPHHGTSLNAKLRAYATYNGCSMEKALEAYKKVQQPIWQKRFAYENGWREWEKNTGRKAVLGNGSYGG